MDGKKFDKKQLEELSRDIQNDTEIRFAGFINKNGKLVAGGFKTGIIPMEDDSERQRIFKELALRVSTRKNFDYKMGRVKYSASRREKIVMMSFPVDGYILLITTEPHINIDRLAYKIIKKMGKDWYEFFGK